MNDYNHKTIEKKWQEKWSKDKLYETGDDKKKPKYYILDMFPYPSGDGLHVGHPKGYIATDILARMKMMQGYNVLHPMGWDAFGLPAENFAIKNKVHPKEMNEKNIATFKSQLEKLGFTYDWSREINTTDPEFYKWTQWIFLQMFKKGLAYESHEPINWCPKCQTGLANEDLENGKCERCDSEIEQKPMRQWVLKITDYAERMLKDLDKLSDWEDSIKEMQRNWIGKSSGASVKFQVKSDEDKSELEVFTTRPDTLFGCTYMVVSPEHSILEKYESQIKNYNEIKKYQEQAKKKTELQRTDLAKEKTGVKIKGLTAVNPVNNEEIPIFVADYVMIGYGTGAIMAVPAHDERDFEFAKKYKINIRKVIKPEPLINFNRNANEVAAGYSNEISLEQECFVGEGRNINSGFLDGMETGEAKKEMIKWLEKEKAGKAEVNYKLNDWVFSRQRYWGEPIPIVHCEKCGVVGVPEDELPIVLPDVKSYEPTGTGESPLANIDEWVNTECPKCGGKAKRETNTMPQWAGSSWYYLRYIDLKNNKELVDKKKEKYWSPVDFYVGGAEHATRHLIYARFWHKFLFDIGVVSHEEPFTKLRHVGLIMAEDGRKMSKRWGNVINPDDIVDKFGADAMRIYEMFMGPFSQSCVWSTNGLVGAKKFLEKVWRIFQEKELIECGAGKCGDIPKTIPPLFHKTIKKVGEDIETFDFNTAISQMMIFVNECTKHKVLPKSAMERFLVLLAPFAPHITEELWLKLGHKESIFLQEWPEYNPKMVQDKEVNLVIQVNGKVRDEILVDAEINEEEAKEKALSQEKIKKWIEDKEIIKVIFVKGKLVNLVVKSIKS
ncbi:leucine--tRNA ligase [Candidatus Falkowbacteria bacterium]|jgi:leucyl-tRNA synthetase|nr:leucine--tRNA ligase [Candidatus Falkowbacteria bacterium]MBT4433578.1 leucine--tRNA ligase [Candidatus Falkowbacteria bacterium]